MMESLNEEKSNQRMEKLSEKLWKCTKDIRSKMLGTHFLQGIKTGTLDPTAFGGYMIQDCVYCYSVQEAFEVAAEKEITDDKLKTFLKTKAESFRRSYNKLSNEWHVANPAEIILGEACKRYSDFEKSVAHDEDPIYLVVALIPCAKLWPWIGQQMEVQEHNYGLYKTWVNSSLRPHSTSFQQYENIIDRAANLGHIEEEKAKVIYTTCMKAEFEFFDSVKSTEDGQ